MDIDSEGSVQRVNHELPESRSGRVAGRGRRPGSWCGAHLADRFAHRRRIAQGSIRGARRSCRSAPTGSSRLPRLLRALPRGELRLSGRIRGDEIADLRRFVFIPEDWERAERNAQTIATVVQGAGVLIAVVMVIAGMIAAIVSWSRRQFSVRLFLAVSAAFLSLSAVSLINNFPALLASLSTSQPLQLQLAVLIGSSAVGLLVEAVGAGAHRWSRADVVGSAIGWSRGSHSRSASRSGPRPPARSSSAPCRGSGPLWPSYAGAAAFVPLLSAATTPVAALILRITILMLMVATANRISDGWTRRRVLTGALLVIVGGVLGNAGSPLNLARVDCVGRDHRRAVAGGLRRRAPASRQHRAVRRGAPDHRRHPSRGMDEGLSRCPHRRAHRVRRDVGRGDRVVPGARSLAPSNGGAAAWKSRRYRAVCACVGRVCGPAKSATEVSGGLMASAAGESDRLTTRRKAQLREAGPDSNARPCRW